MITPAGTKNNWGLVHKDTLSNWMTESPPIFPRKIAIALNKIVIIPYKKQIADDIFAVNKERRC